MTIRSLQNKGKKDVRLYIDSLPGMVPYVAAQVCLLCYDGHAIPVDEILAEELAKQGAIDPKASIEEISLFLERQVRAGQGAEIHALLRDAPDAHIESLVNTHYLCEMLNLIEKDEDMGVKPLDERGSTQYDVAVTHAPAAILAAATVCLIGALKKDSRR